MSNCAFILCVNIQSDRFCYLLFILGFLLIMDNALLELWLLMLYIKDIEGG